MKSIKNTIEDLVKNPPVGINMAAEADPRKYKEFFEHECDYHRKDNPVTGASGGAITYQFAPTTLGTVVKIKCECGLETDITDYRSW
jgi:hypothetical protein